MRISKIELSVVHIRLKKEIFVGRRKLGYRDHVVVRIHTDDGLTGYGHTYGYGAARVLAFTIQELFEPHLIGEDPLNTERLWDKLYEYNWQVGRRGVVVRALSAVDIALWDLKGKAAGLPLYKLLGAYRDKVPIYTSGGYYREFGDRGLAELRQEMELWAARGYKAVKMRVGLAPLEEDLQRIGIAREALGTKADLMLDAELVWSDANTAIKYIKAFERDYDIYWMEGPASLDRIDLHKKIAQSVETPIATGGQMYTRWDFTHWMREGAVQIIQPDVIVCGGITEWLKIAHIADVFDIKVAPHDNWNLHASLVAAVNNGIFVEYFEAERDIKVLDRIIRNPVKPDAEGYISPPQNPGIGFEFDEDRIDDYRVE